MREEPSSRRQFLLKLARSAGAVAVGGVAAGLVFRPGDAKGWDTVWQVDPNLCNSCLDVIDRQSMETSGWGRCATKCVLKLSAVKAVNEFKICGYCLICPGYHDVNSPPDENGVPTGKLCPQDAITRKLVGRADPSDPNNNFYLYTVDETKCNGCGRCVAGCQPPAGNGSLRLEVRHDLCVDCNSCAIAVACPKDAFFRDPARNSQPGRTYTPH